MGKEAVLSPVGRFVGGSLVEASDTDINDKPLVDKNKNPRVEYFIQVAFAKNDPLWPAYHTAIWAEIRAGFPQLFNPANGQPLPGINFHTKVTDGDSQVPNSNGTKPCEKDGFPGCWVVGYKSGFAPRCWKEGNTKGTWDPIDPTILKRGYFVRVNGNISSNNNAQNPGVYMNIGMVEMIAYGQEIQGGLSPQDAFGKAPVYQLPAGASMIPLAPLTNAPAAAPSAPAYQAPVAPPAPAAPAASVTPDYTFAAPPMPPIAPAPPAPPAAPVAEVKYVYSGTAWTEGQLLAVGWKKEQIATLPRG